MCSPVFRSLPSILLSGWRDGAALVTQISDRCEGVQDDIQVCCTPSPCNTPKVANLFVTQISDKCEGVQDDNQVCFTPSPCNTPKAADLPKVCNDVQDDAQVCFTPSPCNTPTVADLPKVCDPPRTEFATSDECTPLSDQGGAHLLCMGQQMTTLPPPASPCNVVMLVVGTAVEIDGLLRRPDFNGKSGVVQSWDPMLRRYNVLLDSSPDGTAGPLHVKTKRENLRLRTPPPPHSAAAILATTIDLDACIAFGSEEVFPCSGGESLTLSLDAASPTMAVDSPGWFSWQYCDADVSPQSWREAANVDDQSATSPRVDQFNTSSGATWEYSSSMLVSNDMVAGFDTQDSATWQFGDVLQGGWQQANF